MARIMRRYAVEGFFAFTDGKSVCPGNHLKSTTIYTESFYQDIFESAPFYAKSSKHLRNHFVLYRLLQASEDFLELAPASVIMY